MDQELRFLTRHWLEGALVSLSSELNRTGFHNQQHSTNTFGVLPLAGVSCLRTCLLCVASEQKTEADVCTWESRLKLPCLGLRFCFPNLGIDLVDLDFITSGWGRCDSPAPWLVLFAVLMFFGPQCD